MSYYLLVPPLLLLPPLLSGGADLSRGAAATLHLARRGGVRARRRIERRAHAGDRRRDRPRRVARVDPDGARGEPAAATRGQGAPGQEAAVRLALVSQIEKKLPYLAPTLHYHFRVSSSSELDGLRSATADSAEG